MREYKWTNRDIDKQTLRELVQAWYVIPVFRRERIADMAHAMRLAQVQKQSDWQKGISELTGD